MKLLQLIIDFLDLNHDKCFECNKSKDGNCYGVVGGDKGTCNLAYQCIDCKHHTFIAL